MPGQYDLSINEAAQYLGLSDDTVRSYCDQELITHLRTPTGFRRFRKSDLDAFLATLIVPARPQ